MTKSAALRHHPDVAWHDSGERVVAVRLDELAAEPLCFEASGADVWRSIDGTSTLADVAMSVAEVYGVDVEVVAPDVTAFVRELETLGLVVPVGDFDP